jgi:hypothetical protein
VRRGEENYVSVIGPAFLQPIATLLESLDNLEPRGANDVQVSGPVNGYSAAICALTVVLIESTLNRARYVRSIEGKRSSIECFAQLVRDPELTEQLTELYVLRDVIAHNHIWLARIDEENMKLLEAMLLPKYGDEKYRQAIDEKTRTTKLLHLNVFPTRIGLSDVRKVLATAYLILIALENLDRRIIYISDSLFTYRRKRLALQDLVER